MCPQLKFIEPQPQSYTECFHDIILLRGVREYQCNDYRLDFVSEDGLFFIMCPKDVVLAKPREDDDHITWLLEIGKFEEALEAVKASRNVRKHSVLTVGKQYMDYLIEESKLDPTMLDKASSLCTEVLGKSKTDWEEEVNKYADMGMLYAIAPHLPRGPEFVLEPSIYQNVLNNLLVCDQSARYLNIIQQWNPTLYDINAQINATIERLTRRSGDYSLQEALGQMYCYDEKYEKAINIYIDIGLRSRDKIFRLIKEQKLYSLLWNKLMPLMEIDAHKTARMLAEKQDLYPLDQVVPRLSHEKPLYLWAYLNSLALRDSESLPSEYHDRLVPLYAEFDPEKLLPFLKASSRYSIETALKVCRERKLIKEIVYLLSRMGDTKKALEYITGELNDINYAIEFCRDNGDKELWDDLIEYSLQKPEFIRVLLQNISTDVPDPIGLINKIPKNIEIPGLVPALSKVLNEYELQISLEEGCRKVLVTDCYNGLENLHKTHKRGLRISKDNKCHACSKNTIPKGTYSPHHIDN